MIPRHPTGVQIDPPRLSRALRALANDSVVAEDQPRRLARVGAVAASHSDVVLAGRATRVPQAAVTSGIQRSTTVSQQDSISWAHAADLRMVGGPNLHGMQGVRKAASRGLPECRTGRLTQWHRRGYDERPIPRPAKRT
jgi:hypothetical protein